MFRAAPHHRLERLNPLKRDLVGAFDQPLRARLNDLARFEKFNAPDVDVMHRLRRIDDEDRVAVGVQQRCQKAGLASRALMTVDGRQTPEGPFDTLAYRFAAQGLKAKAGAPAARLAAFVTSRSVRRSSTS